MVLGVNFFNRPTLRVARELLGCVLVRRLGRRQIRAKIVETEAYCGPQDLASHASRGRTPRNEVMFGPPGYFYVYFVYGMHFMLNVVTEREGYPAAVLIRAVEPLGGFSAPTKGPARLTRSLAIDKGFNGVPLGTQSGLWIEQGDTIKSHQIRRAPRVGVDYAGVYKDKKWRFYLKGNPFVSKLN
ncbi:DNA-3-methyladenine glycosylase [Candidatus Parcubacteria bacterium]|nr:MAG: DNA-3-methyladenine glycosylase [Candidatus Parcubacteria bacterium]